MAAIQSLPEELLIVVVQMVQKQERRSHSTHPLLRSRSMLRSLLRLSLVCTGWREEILKCGVLWASIAVDTSRGDCLAATLTMLERSKGAELELSVCFHMDYTIAERTGSILASILNHHSRITSLHLTADPPFTLKNDIPVPETTANALRTINYPTHPTLPRCLPELFRGLRELSLSVPSSSTTVRISELLDIMKNSQRLELLSLASLFVVKEDCPSTCVVHLPRLRRLSLRECDSSPILSRLVTPKTTQIKITLKSRGIRRYPSLHGVNILSALPASLSSIRALEQTTSLILEEDEGERYFGLGFAPFGSRDSLVVIKSRLFSREKFIRRSLRAISNHSYFDIIESFTFSYSSPVPTSWPTVFSRFCALLELNTLTIHAADVLHTLMQTTFDGTPLCFSLQRIRFFERLPNLSLRLDSQLFTAFHNFRIESHCSAVRITLHYLDGQKEEL